MNPPVSPALKAARIKNGKRLGQMSKEKWKDIRNQRDDFGEFDELYDLDTQDTKELAKFWDPRLEAEYERRLRR